jgi:hypothetical protein
MMDENSPEPLVRLQFDGPAVHEGRILVRDLIQFISNFDLAVQRALQVLEKGRSSRTGRPEKATQLLSALELVAVNPGSFVATLDLRRDDQRALPGFDLGAQAVQAVVAGLAAADYTDGLPQGYDQGVLRALREAGRIIDHGVNDITIQMARRHLNTCAVYNQATRSRLASHMEAARSAWATVEGRLLMADVKEDRLRCQLYPSSGVPVSCKFDEELTDLVISNLRKFVVARGEAEFEPFANQVRSLYVRDIEPAMESAEAYVSAMSPSSFWHAASFSELAEEQGVSPIHDWDALQGGWPEGANFEEFLEALAEARRL